MSIKKTIIILIILFCTAIVVYLFSQSRPAILPFSDNASLQQNTPLSPEPYRSYLPELTSAPDFASNSAWFNTDLPIALENIKGTVSVVFFWRSQCSYCQDAHPYMGRLKQRFGSDIMLIGIYSPQYKDEKRDEVIQADRERFQITYPTLLDFDRAMWMAYEPLGWPHFYVIDATGIIRAEFSGLETETELVSAVEELLKEQGKEIPAEVGFVQPSVDPDAAIPGWISFVHPQLYIGIQMPQSYSVDNSSPTAFTLNSPGANVEEGKGHVRIEFETEYKLPDETLDTIVEKKKRPMTNIISEEDIQIGGYPAVKITREYEIQPIVYYTLVQSRIVTIKVLPGEPGDTSRIDEVADIIETVTFEN